MSFCSKGRTRYNVDWENPALQPKIAACIKSVNTRHPQEDVFYFQCKVCNSGKISLSNMSIGAPKKHMTDSKGKRCRHNIKMTSFKSIRQDCFQPKEGQSFTQSTSENLVLALQSQIPLLPNTLQLLRKNQSQTKTKLRRDNSPPELVKSLILWPLNVVSKHYSLRSGEDHAELFGAMLPDCKIAKNLLQSCII